METYNLLTQCLMNAGYTAADYPDFVRIPTSGWDKNNPLINLYDGFEYAPKFLRMIVFETGCGIQVRGDRFTTGILMYMGTAWEAENNNPVISCPFGKKRCEFKNPNLDHISQFNECDCHYSKNPYEYSRSLEKVQRDKETEKKRKYDEFSERVHGHVCFWQMIYQDENWKQCYDPERCAQLCQNIGRKCSLTHKPVSKKKGNVFYDVKISYTRQDGTLFDGENVVSIIKGKKFFDTNKSLTICEQAAKRCKKQILEREEGRHQEEIFKKHAKIEILNIRAERRESRDLMQDLEDIRNGIKVTYAQDDIKRIKKEKKEKRQQAEEKRIQKLEKKLLEVGYYNLEDHSLDKVHADRWLGEERIAELEEERKRREEEKRNQPVQMSLFDFIESGGKMK